MAYNYSKLKGKIRECGYTQADVANVVGITPETLNKKLRGGSEFRQDEMEKILNLLRVSLACVQDYFFHIDL